MFYIEENGKIVLFDKDFKKIQNTLVFMPQYAHLEILTTEREIITFNDEFMFADEVQEELAQQKAERIAMLFLRRGDVFRGLLKAKGVTKAQIGAMIEAMPETTQEEIVAKEMARIDFEDAIEFYRGNALVNTIGLALGITSEQLDRFFETNDYTTLL